MSALSRNQLKNAGRTLRHWWDGPVATPDEAQLAAYLLLLEYRGSFRPPMQSVNMSLRSMLASEDCPVRVSQRLKRADRVIQKLSRHPSMALPTMADIGGCRAVVNDLDELQRVLRRMRRRWGSKIEKERPYLETPRDTGYRGYHVIVRRHDRLVEVQLRTGLQHAWAAMMEGTRQERASCSRTAWGRRKYLSSEWSCPTTFGRTCRTKLPARTYSPGLVNCIRT
jgi:GTP pyrophosphokinase